MYSASFSRRNGGRSLENSKSFGSVAMQARLEVYNTPQI
ncbi:hypothetical protein LCGC14_1055140 [marine sediment metagenome]|uniref:Uncharacterized protein n=1 Tax=marine sediment metagenome TaxID=412755 RepID=A0A0F9MS86_9ZZZZ